MPIGLTASAPTTNIITTIQGTGITATLGNNLNTALSSLTSVGSSITAGSGMTGIANELASTIAGGVTGSLAPQVLGSITNMFSSGLSIIGGSAALSSSLASLGGASSGTFNGWPQIPAAAKGLQNNGPTPPQGYNLGPLGNVNLADTLGGINTIFNSALSAMQMTFKGFTQS